MVVALGVSLAASRPDPLAAARRLYSLGQYDQALEALRAASDNPAIQSASHLIAGRARLERYRVGRDPQDLENARTDLHVVDPRALSPRERIELQVGLAVLLFFDERFGASAAMLEPLIDATASLAPDAHARALDWWATSMERAAQAQETDDRGPSFERILTRMEDEQRHDPASAPAGYWLAAASRDVGDLDRAWAAASAAWLRASLAPDGGSALRADLDKLVTEAIIPDRAARLPAHDRHQAVAAMTADWEALKKDW